MRKIVLPLIETDRSLMALQYAKKHFGKEQAEIIIVMADESLGISATREEEAEALAVIERKLDVIKKVLDGYQVVTKAFVGKAGPCIVKVAREYNADYIVMTKSAKSDTLSVVGRTTDYVLNNAYCNVLIVSENRANAGEYKGLIYKKAQATVNLRGQIGDKQSECLLPSVDADCNYHFDVTVGKIRFFHTAYNPDTGNWDMPPSGDQTASMDIAAGETADILVKANSVDGKADRIRIINRGMKQEAVFVYKITAASAPEPMEIPDAPGAMPAPAVISLDGDDTAAFEADSSEGYLNDNEETSFDWENISLDSDDKGTIEDTLSGLEMFTPNENEINSIVDELKATITSLDNDIAERESQTIRFGMPEVDIDTDIDVEDFFKNTDVHTEESDNSVNMSATNPAFDDIFEMIPTRDLAGFASTSTMKHDFDEIINEFRTGQIGYAGLGFDEDINLDDLK